MNLKNRNVLDAWRMFLTPRMMSISDFEFTIGFVLQNAFNLTYNTTLSSKLYIIDLATVRNTY